ncbi:MAG: DUF6197 family protein [Mycobacteriaceae bacterium]
MKTSEVLNKAADLIQERGWGQGIWDAGPALCLEGGILAALGHPCDLTTVRPWFAGKCPAFDAVCDYLQIDFPAAMPWQWNDTVAEDASEVIEVLRACAVIEAAREDQDAAELTYAENVAVSA